MMIKLREVLLQEWPTGLNGDFYSHAKVCLKKFIVFVKLILLGIPGVKLLERLSNYDHQRQYRDRARQRLEDTTRWILKEPAFQLWLRDRNPQCLWLTGISKASIPW